MLSALPMLGFAGVGGTMLADPWAAISSADASCSKCPDSVPEAVCYGLAILAISLLCLFGWWSEVLGRHRIRWPASRKPR